MKQKINKLKYGIVRRSAFNIAVAAGCSIDEVLQKNNGDFHVFMRILLTKVCMEQGVSPLQISLFLDKHHSTVLNYEDNYLKVKHLPKFKALEQKYYELYGARN